ncbi:diguanylate cyclase [Methyloraptor flagellatus]|uniref:diguanylate cyclase n=1 Tax=Methyloraptor flagellatus TaxID=3162530 RepID=A0AAU7XDA1_9HYPH
MNIMLVDSSYAVLELMSQLMSESGHNCVCFRDGREAIERLTSDESIDVLITGFELQGQSGLELCAKARSFADNGRPLYVIAMSSTRDEERLAEALDNGAHDFLSKPLRKIELFARLRSAERLMNFKRELVRTATIDSLTETLNRRAFFGRLNRLIEERAPRHAIAIFDVDYFKRINDTWGHDVGDVVLRSLCAVARNRGRLVGRLGGEEFAIVLDGSSLAAAEEAADALRAAVAAAELVPAHPELRVTISLGLTLLRPGEPVAHALKRADVALYVSKTGGRNRVTLAAEDRFALPAFD